MLRVAAQSHRTDTGRQRTTNEDSLFVRAPLFAVADGMGGAQAGEVASKIAVDAFEPVQIDERVPPERFLREIVQEANREINRMSQTDAERSGMGTTLTAALLQGDEISFAHVGDSRAYLYRGGHLRLLTSDHSLVEELRRQGRLTAAQAEDHPQRSIITRALGPEPEVDVDTMTYKAEPGDLYLLCSDGLTTMIKEPRIAELAASAADDLDGFTAGLIRDANEAGGRDNITVVAFILEEAEVLAGAVDDGATLVGPTAESAGLTAGAVREAADRQAPPPPVSTTRPRPGARRRREAPEPTGPGLGRRILKTLVILLITAGIVGGIVYGVRQIYFLGTDDAGRVALYRGLPYDLPLGINLYSEQYSLPIQATSVPPARRNSLTDHQLRGHGDAASLLKDLQTAAEKLSNQREGRTNTNVKTSDSSSKSDNQQGGKSGNSGTK